MLTQEEIQQTIDEVDDVCENLKSLFVNFMRHPDDVYSLDQILLIIDSFSYTYSMFAVADAFIQTLEEDEKEDKQEDEKEDNEQNSSV